MPRVARARSAVGVTTAALLPPSSSSDWPSRPATRAATCRPIATDPVALTSGTRGSSTSRPPTSAAPSTTWFSPSGAPTSAAARSSRALQASAVSGVSSDGFHTTGSPHTRATAAFHDHTATGKLNALITATGPSGCQVSASRCPGRSDGIVLP